MKRKRSDRLLPNARCAALLAMAGLMCLLNPRISTAAEESAPGLEPFSPPTLKELDAKAGWISRDVVDATQRLRDLQKTEKPLCSVKEALSLKNTSKENNAKILSALGRLPDKDSDVNWDATLNRLIAGDVKSTNPIMINSVFEFNVIGLTGAGLFGFDWEMKHFGAKETVVSWQTSQDHLADKVVLRDDWTWSDGQPVTAYDIEFSFQTIMNPKVDVPAMKSETDQLRWVKAYDDHTIVFFHKKALATNDLSIDFSIIPQHIYRPLVKKLENPRVTWADVQQDPEYEKYDSNPVCNGPYTISSRVRREAIVLSRRESYYMHQGKQVRDKPYFKDIRFRVIEDANTSLLALKTGKVDELELNAEQWQNQSNDNEYYAKNTKATGTEWVYYYFGWNCKSPFFSDVRVRKAMSYAFDHAELDRLNYKLYDRCSGIFHPGAWMYPKKAPMLYNQDLDKAEELLDAAGWKENDDGDREKKIDGKTVKFEFTILCSNSAERVKACNLLRQNLKQLGIECTVRPLEFTVLTQNEIEHKFQAYLGGWGTGTDPDTSENVWATKAIKDGRNFVQYSNPKVDELFEKGKLEFDSEKRAAIYAQIHELIYEDQPCTFLYYRNSFYGFSKQLRGYKFSPRGPYDYSPGIGSIWTPVE
ncbi:MAG TPA: ABC transporter substrate-binding protein [Pirellulales bacterium]|jgi:peptide/nickel transport system substrate-binding protein|nr:ABC transporter substrate-binding protein [Pirellulales bacterium]